MAEQIRSYLKKCNSARLEQFAAFIDQLLWERDYKKFGDRINFK